MENDAAGFEDGTSDWMTTGTGNAIAEETGHVHGGGKSVKVYNRRKICAGNVLILLWVPGFWPDSSAELSGEVGRSWLCISS